MSMPLSDAEAERLILLIEEAGEVIQAATKVLRHGYAAQLTIFDSYDNRGDLENELGDLVAVMRLMEVREDIAVTNIASAAKRKMLNAERYLHHNTFNDILESSN